MDTSTLSLREQGIQALREGSADRAVDLLSRAVAADGQDAEAQAYLGVAYCQMGLHTQARQALQTAIELQPQNVHFRVNLGVALERAGDRQGAAAAYRETLKLDPNHAQAKARLEAMGSPDPGGAASASPAPVTAAGSPSAAAPWLSGAKDSGVAPPSPPGTVQCARCGQPSKPGLSCEWCSAPLKSGPTSRPGASLHGSIGGAAGYAMPGEFGSFAAPAMGAGEAFVRRFAAFFIDSLILGIPTGLIFTVVMFFWVRSLMQSGGGLQPPPPGDPVMLPFGVHPFIFQLVTWGVSMGIMLAYHGGMVATRGQTLGKMAMGVRVIAPDGGNPSFGRAALRETIGRMISSMLMLGYLWMLWDAEQQTWHDKIAGTHVERA